MSLRCEAAAWSGAFWGSGAGLGAGTWALVGAFLTPSARSDGDCQKSVLASTVGRGLVLTVRTATLSRWTFS